MIFVTPRAEHPNPQFERKTWRNLNGEWEFEIDKSNSGEERKIYAECAERFSAANGNLKLTIQ